MDTWMARQYSWRHSTPAGVLPNFGALPNRLPRRGFSVAYPWQQPARLWMPLSVPFLRPVVQVQARIGRVPSSVASTLGKCSDTTVTSSNSGRGLTADQHSVTSHRSQLSCGRASQYVHNENIGCKSAQVDLHSLTVDGGDGPRSDRPSHSPTPSFTLVDSKSLESSKDADGLCGSQSVLKISLAFCICFLLGMIIAIIYIEAHLWKRRN